MTIAIGIKALNEAAHIADAIGSARAAASCQSVPECTCRVRKPAARSRSSGFSVMAVLSGSGDAHQRRTRRPRVRGP